MTENFPKSLVRNILVWFICTKKREKLSRIRLKIKLDANSITEMLVANEGKQAYFASVRQPE